MSEALEMVELCPHDVAEQDTAAHADGLCPLCLAVENRKLRDLLEGRPSNRELAIAIYQLFETHSEKRARENFDLYDENPKNLPRELRFTVKQSYAAARMSKPTEEAGGQT